LSLRKTFAMHLVTKMLQPVLVCTLFAVSVLSQGGPGGGPPSNTCSSNVATFDNPAASSYCESSMSTGNEYAYPSGFTYRNKVAEYSCPVSEKRIIVSNNIPNHAVTLGNPNSPCETPFYVSLPLSPTPSGTNAEPADLGLIGIALNGVVIYGAMEGGGTNAVEPAAGAQITDAQYWYGHAAPTFDWHYHNPAYGSSSGNPPPTQLVGYAMDGYPLYGPVADASVLDECNGQTVNGQYQYHARAIDQVAGDGTYCSGTASNILWNYGIGCFKGVVSNSAVMDATSTTLPSDCVLVSGNNVDALTSGSTFVMGASVTGDDVSYAANSTNTPNTSSGAMAPLSMQLSSALIPALVSALFMMFYV